MIPRRVLGAVIVVWTLVTWGGRIGLLTGPDASSLAVWGRIAGSLVAGLGAGAALVRPTRATRPAVAFHAVVTVAVWGSSLVSVHTDPAASAAFRLVHTLLALVSLALAWLAVRSVLSRPERARVGRSGSPSPVDR